MKKQENSTHTSVWIENKLYEECKSNMEKLDIKFFKDYIAEALEFYNQYLKEADNKEYINNNVIEPMEKMLKCSENRIARLMFKQAVEISKIYWLMVRAYEVSLSDAIHICTSGIRESHRRIVYRHIFLPKVELQIAYLFSFLHLRSEPKIKSPYTNVCIGSIGSDSALHT